MNALAVGIAVALLWALIALPIGVAVGRYMRGRGDE